MTGRGRPSTGVKIQVRIPAELVAELDQLAELADLPRAEVLRRAVRAYVDSHAVRRLG